MEKTVEQLKAEAEAANIKLAEAEKAAREAARKAEEDLKCAKAEEARKVRRAAYETHANEIVKALKAVGFNKASWTWDRVQEWSDYPRIVVDPDAGYNTRVDIEFDVVYSGDSWHSKGHTIIRVGDRFQGAHRFPANKEGKFNYEKIAATAVKIDSIKSAAADAAATKEAKRKSSGEMVKRLAAKLGLSDWGGCIQTSDYYGDKVAFKFAASLTEEQVEAAVNALRNIGLEVK